MSSRKRSADAGTIDIARIPQACLGIASRSASRAANRVYAAYLAPLDLQATQFPILVMVALHGAEGIAALAAKLELEASALTRNVQHLERRGLITAQGGRGRQGKQLALTPAGRKLLGQAAARWQAAQQALMAELGDNRAKALRRLLRQLEAAALRLEERTSTA